MLLAGLILAAACANLGGLFAARAADRSREVALRLALGSSRNRILRGLFDRSRVDFARGGAAGLWGSRSAVARAERVASGPWMDVRVPVNPDASVYAVALALALVSALLFGIVPVRQVLRTDPYQVVKSGSENRRRDGGPASGTCCWSSRSPSVRCWSLVRWSPCAASYARCTPISASIRATPCCWTPI